MLTARGGRGRRARAVGWALAAAFVVCFAAPPAASATGWPIPRLKWSRCSGAPHVQCASLWVPLDWSRPRGAEIRLALTRLRATGPGPRTGTVLFNCGGPGCPSAETLKHAPGIFSLRLRRRFDIVAFDPRDTGESTPVRCGRPSLDLDIPRFPLRRSGYERLLAFNRALARSCGKLTGAYLMHVGAVDVVRDMEGIRLALRDGKLNWLGFSYGTMLGGLYAERYPRNIRAMVLDGALDRALREPVMLADEARAAENGFTRWAAWCGGSDQCVLHGQPVLRLWSGLIAGANRSPIPVPGLPRGVTGIDIQSATDEGFLLFKRATPFTPVDWSLLGRAVAAARQGNASLFAPVLTPPPLSGGRAIECLDFPVQARGFGGFLARVNAARRIAPYLGGAVQTLRIISDCAGWPRPRVDPRHVLHVKGAPPVLIVNATHDPSTAYRWARNMHAQIPRSVLLTRDGDGHTSYMSSACAQRAVDRYLISLALPRPGAVCHG